MSIFQEMVPIINALSKEEKEIIEEKKETAKNETKALTVQKEKNSIFNKIKKFLNKITGNSKTKNSPKQVVTNSTNNASEFRNSQRVEKNSNIDSNSKKQTEYVAVSDLHGNINRWNMVKSLLNERPNVKIIMLGDAMDRGEFGPEILLQIKELSDQGRLQYLPGNHDIFAYNYIKMRKEQNSSPFVMAKLHLENNGGEITMEKINNFSEIVKKELSRGNIKNNITLDELATWLGAQPIQKKLMEKNNYTYALSHAIFDEKLYKENPDFNLNDALRLELNNQKESETYRRFYNCMWYRAGNSRTQAAELALPNDNVIVVGHTKQPQINMDFNNPNIPIIYIDTGKGKFSGFDLTKGKSIVLEEELAR